MHFIRKNSKSIIILILILLGMIKFYGACLDNNAENASLKMYSRDNRGIVNGMQSIIIKKPHSDSAILLIHGFEDSPAVFKTLIDDLSTKSNIDIYAPLLPFHGRTLQKLTNTNTDRLLNYISVNINNIANKYKTLTIVGMSFGGSLIADLAYANKLPKNVKIVLYAPAFYIKSNTLTNRSVAALYSNWRNYCNYAILGCKFPNFESADAIAKPILLKEKTFNYINIKALLEMYQFDLENRAKLSKIKIPYEIIIAKDDNRVDYQHIKDDCYKNSKFCEIISFESGKHIIHWGENRSKFANILIAPNTLNISKF